MADEEANTDGGKTDYDKFMEDLMLCRYIIVGFGFFVTMVRNQLIL